MTVQVSVCIPVWNDDQWLPGAIESVLAQTHPEWELIIGDNASEQDLSAIVARYNDPRIKYHRFDRHVNLFENYNRVITLAQFPWVNWLSADDRLEPLCLAKIAERIEQAQPTVDRLAAVLTACYRVDSEGKPADRAFYGHSRLNRIADGTYSSSGWFDALAVSGQLPWNFSSAVFSREILVEAGCFRPDVGLGGDLEVVLRICAYGSISFIDEPLMRYTVRGTSVSSGYWVKNLAEGDPLTDYGAAWIYGLRAHTLRRNVTTEQRAHAHDVIARSHIQRATQQRLQPGGRGRIGALQDIVRAFQYSPKLMLSPVHVGASMVVLTAPKAVVSWAMQRAADLRGRG
jgi:glycosyltransferase involved in cell wall biosynthesis